VKDGESGGEEADEDAGNAEAAEEPEAKRAKLDFAVSQHIPAWRLLDHLCFSCVFSALLDFVGFCMFDVWKFQTWSL